MVMFIVQMLGGVVGATFASGGSTDTIVNINTAINHGKDKTTFTQY